MKRIFSTMAVAALLLAGVTSCAKDENGVTETGTGTLEVHYALDQVAKGRAIADSPAKPSTAWTNMNNKLMLLLVDASNNVVDAKAVPLPAVPTGITGNTQTLTELRAGTWTAYIIGNHPTAWTAANVKGKSLTDLAMTIALPDNNAAYVASGMNSAVAGSTGWGEAPEVFVAKQTGVQILEGQSNDITSSKPFTLARAVSQIRIRVDQDGENGLNAATKVKFDAGKAAFAVRRVMKTYNLSGIYGNVDGFLPTGQFPGTFAGGANTDVFFSNENMQFSNPATGYSDANTILNTAGSEDFWNDYLVWCGGGSASESAKRFDILLMGTAQPGYIPYGETTGVTAETKVYWSAQVDGKMGPNQILELKITLNTAGSRTPPEIGSYGDLKILVTPVAWGSITSVNIPI
jgi:hypothetical protein